MIESVIMIDTEHKITIINNAACQLLSVQRDDVMTQSVFDVVRVMSFSTFILDTI